VTDNYSASLRMMNYPIINRDDLIVEVNSNLRWNVWERRFIEWRRVPVIQTARIEQVPPGNIRYEVNQEVNTLESPWLKS